MLCNVTLWNVMLCMSSFMYAYIQVLIFWFMHVSIRARFPFTGRFQICMYVHLYMNLVRTKIRNLDCNFRCPGVWMWVSEWWGGMEWNGVEWSEWVTQARTHTGTQARRQATTQAHSHSITQSLSHSVTQSLSHSLTHSLAHSLPHSLTPSLPHSLTPSLTHSLTHYLPPSLPRACEPASLRACVPACLRACVPACACLGACDSEWVKERACEPSERERERGKETHTCSELSLRILFWSASYVRSFHLTGMGQWRGPKRYQEATVAIASAVEVKLFWKDCWNKSQIAAGVHDN